ncbi:hypothetical protein KR018_000828 [Drosophila ironensis]|nr:hypothetical protein KR018_000828 [Drosophila ironensis]
MADEPKGFGRLARWSMKLQGFNFEILHRKGTQNVVADTLSRQLEAEIEEFDFEGPIPLDHLYTAYFMAFGQNMILHGKDYQLLRSLNLLSDDTKLSHPDMLQVVRQIAKENINKTHEANARIYNLRSRKIELDVGDHVFARNFTQSSAVNKFNSKLAPTFRAAIVHKKLGPVYYELWDRQNKRIGVYHLKYYYYYYYYKR